MLQLKIVSPTVLKQRPIQSSDLPDGMKETVELNAMYPVSSYTLERSHLRVVLTTAINGVQVWYAFCEHAQILQDGKVAYPTPVASKMNLAVPYRSQVDNEENPFGSCNVTSTAMVLMYLGIQRKSGYGGYSQFEDELYAYCEDHGLSRHDPNDLARLMQAYGATDNFRPDATIAGVKEWLSTKKIPVITHGYFTTSGHIVVLTGFDETGFIVNDPYGEWNSWGYDRNSDGDIKGKGVHYSYDMIRKTCIPDGSFWVHFVTA